MRTCTIITTQDGATTIILFQVNERMRQKKGREERAKKNCSFMAWVKVNANANEVEHAEMNDVNGANDEVENDDED